MNELTFQRAEPGTLIVTDPEGTEHALPVTDQVRAGVREATAHEIPDVVIQIPEELRPKDIQSLVRAGASPEELAQTSGLELDYVLRYAAPVLDERVFVAGRARGLTLSHELGAPDLERLAAERLAERGVDTGALEWDAVRQAGHWVVRLDFEASEGPSRARWQVDLPTGTLTPLDEQANWIGRAAEPDSPIPPLRRLGVLTGGSEDAEDPADSPYSLLDGLMDARGLRDPAPPAEGPDQLSGHADVLELRRPGDTEAMSYMDPAPVDSIGNPITFLQDLDEDDSRPLPEPLLPDETNEPDEPAGPRPEWLAAPEASPVEAPAADLSDAVAPDEAAESRRPRRDMIWDHEPEPADRNDPATDRVSIWNRSAAAADPPAGQLQGQLFDAAPVDPPAQA
ncbi:MAG: DUF3071 domain-containing protein, partial [Bifidobacteriaceae bacterium]|nr:DUF3071 domain-containing protein [Bifidobacteriaceae bacterium]